MREIKFRLIKNGKVVGYEQHALITYHSKKEIGIFHSTHGNLSELEVYNILCYPDKFIPHDTKEQFTGIKDKNGQEAYHRDICLYRDDSGQLQKGVIDWSDQRAAFFLCAIGGDDEGNQDGDLDRDFEVIGTIHDNETSNHRCKATKILIA